MDFTIVHENRWHWGREATIVLSPGLALCRVSVEDDNLSAAYLSDVIVHEYVRRQGFGNRLLKEAVKIAKKMGAKKLFLWVNSDSWMKDWYGRYGFRISSLEIGNEAASVIDLMEIDL